MRQTHARLLGGCALVLLLGAACTDESGGDSPRAEQTTVPSPTTPGTPSTSDPSTAPTQPPVASGPEARRTHYTVRLPDGFTEMPPGTLGEEAVVGCADGCAAYLAVSDPTPVETGEIDFDLAVDSMVKASILEEIRRLPDEEHFGRRTYHLAGTDGKKSMQEFGFLAPGYEVSIRLTMVAPPSEVEHIAREVLASLVLR
ncbi:hypothetical protein [Nocardioides daejeonensis]|uniref:hypothetical protein n=1 Tax=Nocardioides daejeonensis TaxID=1046556 RepID=UPI000D744467|nr:hypothetical protein [Nocardioides daejeonensis]